MLCGNAANFKTMQGEEIWDPTSPKVSKKKANKNPFSSRGLDKYSTVLAELEARKAKIKEKLERTQQGVSMVRFMYSSSKEWIPVIIQLQDLQKRNLSIHQKPSNGTMKEKALTPLALPMQTEDGGVKKEENSAVDAVGAAKEKTKARKSFSWKVEGASWKEFRPRFYLSLVAILILLCLVVFGKTFAICCTSVFWYLVPLMQDECREVRNRRSFNKGGDYARRISNNKMGGNFALACSHLISKKGG